MNSAKNRMLKIIEEQPDDSSFDDILRELVFGRMVGRGLSDSDAGRTIGDNEIGRQIQMWRK